MNAENKDTAELLVVDIAIGWPHKEPILKAINKALETARAEVRDARNSARGVLRDKHFQRQSGQDQGGGDEAMSDIGETLNHLADVVAENHKLKAEVGALKERAEQAEIERDALKEALREIGNKAGAPSMSYAPHIERREFIARIQQIAAIVVKAKAQANFRLVSPPPPDHSGERDKAIEEVLAEAEEYVEIAAKFLKYQRPGKEFYPNREGAEACLGRIQALLSKTTMSNNEQ